MTLTIDLSPSEEVQFTDVARQEGLQPADFVKKLVAERLPPEQSEPHDPTLALFAQWAQEDAKMTPGEIEQERRLWEQFEANVNETREALGMERL